MLLGAFGEYEELKRELTEISRKSATESKLEQGGAADAFDLSEFLQGISDASREAGHKPKHLGLIWKNLVVKVGNESMVARKKSSLPF